MQRSTSQKTITFVRFTPFKHIYIGFFVIISVLFFSNFALKIRCIIEKANSLDSITLQSHFMLTYEKL